MRNNGIWLNRLSELLHIDCTDEISGAARRLLQVRQMNRGLCSQSASADDDSSVSITHRSGQRSTHLNDVPSLASNPSTALRVSSRLVCTPNTILRLLLDTSSNCRLVLCTKVVCCFVRNVKKTL